MSICDVQHAHAVLAGGLFECLLADVRAFANGLLCCLMTMPSSCTLWRQSGLHRKVSANACHILGPILLELSVTPSSHNARQACAAR